MAPLKSSYRIDGARLRTLRAERGWTKIDLWRTSGLSERTISALELGESRGSAESARALAKTFDVPVATLWVSDATIGVSIDDSVRAAEPAAKVVEPASTTPVALPPPKRAKRTRLDALADLERAHGIDPPPVAVGKTKLPLLTAVRMQNVFATHATFDGERFAVTGLLDRQRALSREEARAIGSKVGVGARFEVARDVIPGEALITTVHVADGAMARALQPRMKHQVTLVVRVDVVGGDDDARVMSLFGSERMRGWGFLGERVVP